MADFVEKPLWYDKHRPNSLDDYVWADPKLKGIVLSWIAERNIPSMIIAGGPGRGKSTLVRLIIKALGIESGDILILKGPSENNADTMRGKVQEFCELGWSELRIVYIDEADSLSHTAQSLLRNIIDNYSDKVRFIFTCNYPHKIIEPVAQSRLFRIDIDKLPPNDFLGKIISVLQAENIVIDDISVPSVTYVNNVCYPDLRRALNLLQNSVIDGKLQQIIPIQSSTSIWEKYFSDLFRKKHDILREIIKIRETLAAMTPDEMEDVYRFLYHNSVELFADKQVPAIFIINRGQKSHRNALLPEMILLEVLVRLMGLDDKE